MRCPKCGKYKLKPSLIDSETDTTTICQCDPITSDGKINRQGGDGPIVGVTNNHYISLSNHYVNCHNSAFKFRIIKDSQIGVKSKGFKGNTSWLTFKGHKVMKSSNWLVIYNNKRIHTDTDHLIETEDAIRESITILAKEISKKYNIVINEIPYPMSSNRPECKLTNIRSDFNFVESEVKAVYPLPSPIEFTGKNAVNNTLNFTSMLDRLHTDLDLLSKELRIHSEVENRANEFLKIANERLRPSPFLSPLESLLNITIKIRDEIDGLR